MRRGFTMIELIFVIVILGILAAVAIPKLMATRDDAKIAAMSQQIQSAIQEIPQYVVSQGQVATDLATMSQVIAQLVNQGKAKYEDPGMISGDGANQHVKIYTETADGNTEPCIGIEVNSTTMAVSHADDGTPDTICTGVEARIAEGNFTIRGTGVTF